MKKLMALCVAGIFLMASCAGMQQSKTTKGAVGGAAAGAAVGAVLGQVFGKDTESTLKGAGVGAAIGGGLGAVIGRMMDQQEQALRDAVAVSTAQAASTRDEELKEELKTEVVREREDLVSIVLNGDVTFDTGSARVKPEMRPEINRIAQVMVQYPDTMVTVEGHTDSVGSESTNMALSKRRADAVRAMIVQGGVSHSRVRVMAFGESDPIADNRTKEGQQKNRRVEIKIQPTGT